MRAVYASRPDTDDPLSALEVGERPDPDVPDGWVRVRMQAASLNRHDIWTLRGVGIKPDQFPMILGCDGAGELEDGSPVVVYPVIATPGWRGDETFDPRRTLLTELHQGAMAQYCVVPAANVLPRPESMGAAEAATLGCTYLTAYRMIFTRSGLTPGSTMLVQGAAGGVATALIQLGVAGRDAGVGGGALRRRPGTGRCCSAPTGCSSRAPGCRSGSTGCSIRSAPPPGRHSMKAVRPGGVVVTCGATTGADPSADLQRLFFLQISVIGSTMGTLDELRRLIAFCAAAKVTPVVDQSFALDDAAEAFGAMESGPPRQVRPHGLIRGISRSSSWGAKRSVRTSMREDRRPEGCGPPWSTPPRTGSGVRPRWTGW